MTDVFAKAGELVTTEDGKVICRVKNDLKKQSPISALDFDNFADDEIPWEPNTRMDTRCIRVSPNGGLQICIDKEWRPTIVEKKRSKRKS